VVSGKLNLGTDTAATLTLDGTLVTQDYSDAVTGTTTFHGHLIKQGAGTWRLDVALPDVTSITVLEGRLILSEAAAPDTIDVEDGASLTVDGPLGPGTTITVKAGGTLDGEGTIDGDVILLP